MKRWREKVKEKESRDQASVGKRKREHKEEEEERTIENIAKRKNLFVRMWKDKRISLKLSQYSKISQHINSKINCQSSKENKNSNFTKNQF